jgi:hypothetical protein
MIICVAGAASDSALSTQNTRSPSTARCRGNLRPLETVVTVPSAAARLIAPSGAKARPSDQKIASPCAVMSVTSPVCAKGEGFDCLVSDFCTRFFPGSAHSRSPPAHAALATRSGPASNTRVRFPPPSGAPVTRQRCTWSTIPHIVQNTFSASNARESTLSRPPATSWGTPPSFGNRTILPSEEEEPNPACMVQ